MKKIIIPMLAAALLFSACCIESFAIKSETSADESPAIAEMGRANDPAAAELTGVEIGSTIDESGEYTDGVGNIWTYSFRLPKILGVDTEYTRVINNKMDELITSCIQPGLDGMSEGYSLGYTGASYEYAVNGDIISLVVSLHSDWGMTYNYAYNLDSHGNEVSKSDVLAAAGYTEESFLQAARDRLNSYFSVFDMPAEYLSIIEECRLKTVDPANCNMDMQVFLGMESMLCFEAQTYSAAGADSYYHIFALGTDTGFTENQLAALALSYYEYSTGYRPQYVGIELEGGTAYIQLYDQVDGHNSTANWYTVDTFSGVGTDIMNFPINITCR